MVRFARAEGSKGSNKRQTEEPTPWSEMVQQIESNKKKKRKIEIEKPGNNDNTLYKIIKGKEREVGARTQDDLQNTLEHTKKQTFEANSKKNEPCRTMQGLTGNKTKKKKGSKTSEPEYTITPEGKRVKVFRDGTQRTWFDLPYEESDLMTRYEGMWVKKEMVGELDRLKTALEEEGLDKKQMMRKMMKAKRKAHRQLRIEMIYQQKRLVSEAIGEELKDITSPKKKEEGNEQNYIPLSKKKQKLVTRENTYSSLIPVSRMRRTEDGESNCFVEDLDLKSSMTVLQQEDNCSEKEGNESMKGGAAIEKNVKVKRKEVKSSSDEVGENRSSPDYKGDNSELSGTSKVERSNEEDNVEITGIEDCKVKKKKKKKKGDKEGQYDNACVAVTSIDIQVKEEFEKSNIKEVDPSPNQEVHSCHLSEAAEDWTPPSTENLAQSHDLGKTSKTSKIHMNFEENELMTNYKGYWVLHEDVEYLEAESKKEIEKIHAARTDGDGKAEGELTQEEQVSLQRAMKKMKKFLHRKLLKTLSMMGIKVGDGKKRKQNTNEKDPREKVNKDDSDKVVKFDGFWVKKDAADRLHNLRKKLYKEGLSQQEVDSLVQKERRKEERVLKNERKLVCLNCRLPGHMVSACPNIVQAEGEGQPSICYTCGSTEHSSSTCNLKKGSEKSFSFATCYICKESGHIARQCPDNPRGLYPKGGACRGCGSVEHLAKDCPDLQKEKEVSNIRVERLKGEELEALDAEVTDLQDDDEGSLHVNRIVPKVVIF